LEPGLVPDASWRRIAPAYDVQTSDGGVRTRLPGRLMHDSVDVAVGGLGRPGRRTDPRGLAAAKRDRPSGRRPHVGEADARRERRLAFIVTFAWAGARATPHRALFVTIWESGAVPEIVLTKADRLDDPSAQVASVEAVAVGVPIYVVSGLTGQGLR